MVTQTKDSSQVFTGPSQVWSWDITYLQTSVKGLFFYLYMIIDVWSRKIVAAQVFDKESMDHSSVLLAHACRVHGVQPEELVLHSDTGGPMVGGHHAINVTQIRRRSILLTAQRQ